MVVVIIGLVLVAVVAWMVRAAGWRFAAKRLSGALLVVVLVTFLTTLLLRQVPGDPCVIALNTAATEETVAQCREDRGLDENVVVQYTRWAGDIVTGDLGFAQYRTEIPLTEVLAERAPRSGWLFLYSQVIALGIAVPLGIWSAYQASRGARQRFPSWGLPALVAALVVLMWIADFRISTILIFGIALPAYIYNGIRGGPAVDGTVNITAFILLSIPVFVVAESLRYEFAIQRDWYDLVGYSPWSEGVGAHLSSVWLPALVLGLAVSPVYLRLLRADMIQNLQQDYVAVAKAKGMTNRHILLRHVLRPSTLTLLTVAGLNIAQLVNGAIVVEFIYDFDGLGSYLLDAVYGREFFPIQSLVAIVAALFVLTNMAVDVLYTAVDPRVSVEAEK